ncbi:MAG: SIMPL domain-containing protein [Cyanobium sp. CZS 48M]|nr:SIMPL domain-containing protein [Cyanobium sp. CZS48M]
MVRLGCHAGVWPLALLLLQLTPPVRAQQVQLRCDGTLLEARGSAEKKRTIDVLKVSMALSAEAATADGALGELQRRLAVVRQALQRLQVMELTVSSPSSWERPASSKRPAAVEANLQVSGELAPARLQALVREVGALPGVRLNPVSAQADQAGDDAVRRQLLRLAYQDALLQARQLAEAIGLGMPTPLEVQIDGGFRPIQARGMAADAVPPFDPGELPSPTDRLGMVVRFCAR